MIKLKLFQIAKNLITWDKKLEIYANGEDNAYAERCERLRINSVTATMASSIMTQYLIGKGFGELDNLKIGNQILIDITDQIAKDLTDNRGVFIHVNYNANYEISDFKHIPFSRCRIGKKDSSEYNGKILVYSNWNEQKINKKDVQTLDVFNPDHEIVKYQIEKCGGIENYKGQVFYFNMDKNFYYPLSRVNAVLEDCDNEAQASVYKNRILRNGFIQSTFFITRPLIENNLIEEALVLRDPIALQRYKEAESELENFKATGQKMLGADGVGGFLHIELDHNGDKLEDAFKIETVKSDVNPDLFKYVEESAVKKILMAYNNLPSVLVQSDNSFFSAGGDALRVAKETYFQNTNKERNLLETIVNMFLIKLGHPYTPLIPLINVAQ